MSMRSSRPSAWPASACAAHRRHSAGARGRRGGGSEVLLEGQLGALRDLDWGTYPYVTSSSPRRRRAVGAAFRRPYPRSVGVAKAYTTAVGTGRSHRAARRRAGHLRELGSDTGRHGPAAALRLVRPVAVRHAARLNGFTELALTKLDVLDTFAN